MRSMSSLRAIRRAAVAGLAMAGACAFGVQPAGAGQTAETGMVSTQAPTAAAVITTRGYTRWGDTIRREVWFNVDHTNNRVRAYSRITDRSGAGTWWVATSRVRLQISNGSGWVNAGYASGDDGWKDYRDTDGGRLWSCTNGHRYWIRTVAYFEWWRYAYAGGAKFQYGTVSSFIC